jgi:uncharacterized phage-associated protein
MARVEDVAAFVLEQCGTITTFKLHKLLYYAQGWALAWDGAKLFDAKIKAYENGPCVSTLFHEHRGQKHVSRWPQGDSSRLTPEEVETIRAVLEIYGAKTPAELVNMTHAEPPWLTARTADKEATAREITLESMRAYFASLATVAKPAHPEAHGMAKRLANFLDGSDGGADP